MKTDAEIKAALSEFDAFWLTLDGEVRGEPVEGQIAVASVIRTRVHTPRRFGGNYKAVCLRPWQFSCWNEGTDKNHVRLMKLAVQVTVDEDAATTFLHDPIRRQLRSIASAVIAGNLMDNAQKANHYLTTELFNTKPPKWARGQQPVAFIGGHVFLRLG